MSGGPEDKEAIEPASNFAGEPDAFERLWTPHRAVYVSGEAKVAEGASGEACPFCAGPRRSDEDSLIVARGTHVFAVLNLYPYNPGHLLVCPYRHVADYADASAEERAEIAEFTAHAMRTIRAVKDPVGFNLGINQGAVAGAGVASHLHQHIVPRWQGDANFFPLVAHVKAVAELLTDTRKQLADAWPTVED